MKVAFLFRHLCCFLLVVLAAQHSFGLSNPYFTSVQMPNMVNYLPPPPDTLSSAFAFDIMRYMWGKQQRLNPERAATAVRNASTSITTMSLVFSDAFGLTISQAETPETYALLQRTMPTCMSAGFSAKNFYKRKRPYMRFNEPTLVPNHEVSLAKDGSYPSGHTILGWSTALLLSEINPLAMDRLLACGYDYGQCRIIAGFHWNSDVLAGYLVASAAVARLHTNQEFLDQLAKAQNELAIKSGLVQPHFLPLPDVEPALPDIPEWLPEPPRHGSPEHLYDLTQYYEAKSLRDDPQTMIDACVGMEPLMATFSDVINLPITADETPFIYNLLKQAYQASTHINKRLSLYFDRPRPFAQTGEESAIPEMEDSLGHSGSFPSRQAMMGWTYALLLLDVEPKLQNEILKRGFDIGQSQVINGHQWQNDVNSSRMMGMALYVRLCSDAQFRTLMRAARREYVTAKYGIPHDPKTDNEIGRPENQTDDAATSSSFGSFSITGRPVPPSAAGIVISPGRKVVN